MVDSFTDYYSPYLDATYDCVDRIVLNAYFLPGRSPAGFRFWWRRLKGSDAELDNAHLMRFAGRVSRRIRAYANKNNIPIEKCQGEQKRDIAKAYLPDDASFVGVFLIVIARAPATVFDIQRSGAILERFLETLSCLDVCCITDNQLDGLPKPGLVGQTRIGGVDINKVKMRTVIDAGKGGTGTDAVPGK